MKRAPIPWSPIKASHAPPLFRGAASLVLMVLAGTSTPADAELAVLTNGDVLKVESYELKGDRMRLGLPAGGFLTLPVARIERIIDDEIVDEPSLPAVPEVSAPLFSLAFEPSEPVPKAPFGDLIYAAAQQYELNPRLLVAMARAESSFDSAAISVKGARGLLQLMPATAERFGVEASELLNPESNLQAAARYLRFLIGEFEGNLRHILAAYNAGEGAVRRHGGVPPYRETRNYIRRIYSYLDLEAQVEG